MRLFAKHILRTLKNAPLQPLLILLTVSFSVAIAISALRLPTMFAHRAERLAQADRELGELLVTVRGDSRMRMILGGDAEAEIGSDGTVCGEFRLTGFTTLNGKTELLEVSATDPIVADRFYDFQYTAMGSLTTENLRTSAILSDRCAEKLGVSLGDTVSFRMLEESFTFTVRAIAESSGLLSDADLLIPMESVHAVLASRVPVIASLGSDFRLHTRLMINTADGVTPEALAERLSKADAFANYTVTVTGADAQYSFLLMTQTLAIWIPALLLLILTAYLILTSLKLLQHERSEQLALFSLCGAYPRQLRGLQYAEGLIYGVLGGLLGSLLAAPIVKKASTLYFWQDTVLEIDRRGVLGGILWACFLITLCTAIHLRRRPVTLSEQLRAAETVHVEDIRLKKLLPPLAVCVMTAIIILLSPPRARVYPAIAALLGTVWFFARVSSGFLQKAAGAAERLILLSRRPVAWLLLAVQQLRNCFALRHVGKIAILSIGFLLAISSAVNALSTQGTVLENSITAQLIGINVDVLTADTLKENPAVQTTSRMSFQGGVELPDGVNVFGISAENSSCLSGEIVPNTFPVGNEAVITESIARLTGVRVGDTLPVTIQGVERTLTVKDIYRCAFPLLYFDSTAFGLTQNLLCISLADGIDESSPDYHAMIATLEENGCELIDSSTVFRNMPETFEGFCTLLDWSMLAAAVIAAVGLANSFAEQYRRRRHDRFILRMNGMTATASVAMQLCEIVALLLCSVLAALPLASIFCFLIDVGVRSFGIVFLL